MLRILGPLTLSNDFGGKGRQALKLRGVGGAMRTATTASAAAAAASNASSSASGSFGRFLEPGGRPRCFVEATAEAKAEKRDGEGEGPPAPTPLGTSDPPPARRASMRTGFAIAGSRCTTDDQRDPSSRLAGAGPGVPVFCRCSDCPVAACVRSKAQWSRRVCRRRCCLLDPAKARQTEEKQSRAKDRAPRSGAREQTSLRQVRDF